MRALSGCEESERTGVVQDPPIARLSTGTETRASDVLARDNVMNEKYMLMTGCDLEIYYHTTLLLY